ncbi:MAG: trypsin-like peptidase domain-containing protein [Tannerellaceae bacterium]|nr:trypsin-like peptidase domain-containing protein [Tannerellaceae bacterium]
MKRLIILTLILSVTLPLFAQKDAPKWVDKAKKAVVTISTYSKDGNKINSGTGFFVTESGDVLSAYSLFKKADRATVTDTEGKTYPVTMVAGADELYDVIKVRTHVPKKVSFLPVATAPQSEGETVYLLPYSTAKIVPVTKGSLAEISKLKDNYSYYQVDFPLQPGQENAPLLTANGEVFGLAQEDASGKKESSFAVSAGYANSLAITSSDAFNSAYNNLRIKRAWPADKEDALISFYLRTGWEDAQAYLDYINDFLATFPDATQIYHARASHYVRNRSVLADTPAGQAQLLKQALDDLATAARYTDNKAEIDYFKAQLIYEAVVQDSTLNEPGWSLDAALATIQAAIATGNLPVYHQLKADIHLARGENEQALEEYLVVAQSGIGSAESYYMAAKVKQSLPGAQINEVIALMDSAIAKFGTPTPAEAAPFILERIDLKLLLNQFEEVIADYDQYYEVVRGNVNDMFYYYRQQAKFRHGDNEGALADIREAIRLSEENPDFYAEEAAVLIRLQNYPEAIASIEKALAIAPDFGACYRLKGICQVRMEQQAEACESLQKANELGDPLAGRLLKEHCQ